MRTIKFRAWDLDFKKMLMVNEAAFVNGIMIGAKGINWDSKVIVMQFTGLLDKNGKEIYEGDIIEYKYTGAGNGIWKDNPPMTGIIEWNNTAWAYKPLTGKKFSAWLISMPGMGLETSQKMCEIIGNIYENPELLEVK